MPKAKKFVSRKRARSYLTRRKKSVKRVKKFRRVKGKRAWYKKYKAKYAKSSKKGIRHKYTLWLDLAQFLTLPYASFIHPVCQATLEDQVNGFATEAGFNDSCGQWLGDLLTVCSTADCSAGTRPESTDAAKFMHFTAWNPFLCQETLGGRFNELLINYNQVKFSGVKVSWKPTIKYVNTRTVDVFNQNKVVPETGTSQQLRYNYMEVINGTSYPGIQPSESGRPLRIDVSGKFGFVHDTPQGIEVPVGLPNWDNSGYGGYDTPPLLRLWINFDKQGYEARDILQEEMCKDGNAETGKSITGSRYMTGKICDQYGQYINFPLVKSFSLSRPFKFYVRPKVVSQLYEAPSNNAVIRDREEKYTKLQAKVIDNMPNGGVFATSLKTMPYVSVGNLYPYQCPFNTPPGQQKNMNIWLINNVKQYGFTDPILFGWMLTDDAVHEGKTSCPFSVVDNTGSYQAGTRMLQFNVESYHYLRGIGKFKVTFYTKWRGKNAYNFPRNISNAFYNANYGRDQYDPYGVMEEEDPNIKKPENELN